MSKEHWNTPKDYKVNSYCTNCGRDFAGDSYFDRHRIGKHQYSYEEGLTFDPPVEDGRRCMTDEEMNEAGMRVMTDEEMLATNRHAHRQGHGVEMWFDPSERERLIANRTNDDTP